MAKNGRKSILNVAAKFGGVSIGQETARIGVTFDRSGLNLEDADAVLCGHRLNGRVQLGNGTDPNQGKLIADVDVEITGAFDAKKLSVSPQFISTGLTFALADIDVSELARFSKGNGRLIVEHVAEIPESAPAEHDEDEDENKHVAGTFTVDGDPRRVLLSRIFKGAILKSLEGAGLNDVAALGKFTEGGKKLAEIDGIGPGKAAMIAETLEHFWEDNPEN
jgi:hypothetical protein